MATKKKLLEAAAGAAGGGAALNVEQLFSTYLYEGNGAAQAIDNGIALADGVGGGTSTLFDGSSDYLQRGTTFTNNTNSKTLTLSFWFRWDDGPNENERIFGFYGDSTGSNTNAGLGGYIDTSAKALKITHGNNAFNWNTPNNTIIKGKWTHFLMSIDMDTQSNTKVYIDDVAITGTYTYFVTGTAIKGDTDYNSIGAFLNNQYSQTYKGNLAHFYVDYTWRDLATTSNRRIFIDADGGSTSASSLAANNPILYFPMTDAYSLGENAGTGGDLTAYGSPTIVDSGTEYLSNYSEGGLVWVKNRDDGTADYSLWDTERGSFKYVKSNATDAEIDLTSFSTGLTAFNSNGFTLSGGDKRFNKSANDLTSWTFRKAPKFFDVVTYTGNGTAGRTVSHNLGTTVGSMFIKRTDTTQDWIVYHRGLNSADGTLILNENWQAYTNSTWAWNSTYPTSTDFTLGSNAQVNASGATYVAYLFAHNDGDGDFGPTGDQDIIKCGSVTLDGSGNATVDLGFEPQWLMIKSSSSSLSGWHMLDNMRGIATGSTYQNLLANSSGAEVTSGSNYFEFTADGFKINAYPSGASTDWVYIAIRRGPMAVPESATDVFDVTSATGTGAGQAITTGFPVDTTIVKKENGVASWEVWDRLRGAKPYLFTESTNAEGAFGSDQWLVDDMTGFSWNSGDGYSNTSGDFVNYSWKRAPSFFDIVAYTGTGSSQSINHNLGVAPEMMWVKNRSSTANWSVYHKDLPSSGILRLNQTVANQTGDGVYIFGNDSTLIAPTDTVFTVGGADGTSNTSGSNYIIYLFASLDGVSKVGSFTYTQGVAQNIDCGFSSGARFVLYKRTSGTSGWTVFDTERGIVAGNDPMLFLNTTSAEDSNYDFIDPYSGGFALSDSTANLSGDYIFYAIA
jgi:hypothetical protein